MSDVVAKTSSCPLARHLCWNLGEDVTLHPHWLRTARIGSLIAVVMVLPYGRGNRMQIRDIVLSFLERRNSLFEQLRIMIYYAIIQRGARQAILST